jgi:hypothetical protein
MLQFITSLPVVMAMAILALAFLVEPALPVHSGLTLAHSVH